MHHQVQKVRAVAEEVHGIVEGKPW